MPDEMAAKAALRRQMNDIREALSSEQAERWSQQIVLHLLSSPLLQNRTDQQYPFKIGLFVAMRQEVDLSSGWKLLQANGHGLCFPRMTVRDGQPDLDFLAIPDQADPRDFFVHGRFGVSEPAASLGLVSCEPDIIILPGLAFDPAGHRLGWGKGYYDHYLARRRLTGGQHPVCIGVAYPFQIIEHVPAATWDIPVDYLLSPEGFEPVR